MYFLGVHITRLSTRCKMFYSKITQPFPLKSHECTLKLTDMWFTSLLFDLNQGSKFKFEFGSTCATRCKFLGAQLKILGAQLIMLGASISKEK